VRRLAHLTLLLIVLAPAVPGVHAQNSVNDWTALERGVVGLRVTYQMWDEDRPWAKQDPGTRNISAVVVGPRTLLTTHQEISHATFIKLETFGRSRNVEPRIERIDGSINLALLAIDDPDAAAGLAPVEVAPRTPTSGTLQTVRWRGQQLEAAASRIVRFEVGRSWGSRTYHAFLHMRTDVAGGGWAEPVFDGDVLVGIAVSQSEQRSKAIPAEILRAFLERSEGPGSDGRFSTLGVNWQVNRDESVSRFLGQPGEPQGVLVRQVPWGSSGCGVLKPRDIILELDGHAIDADGHYDHPWLGRLRLEHILAEGVPPGERVRGRLLRDGREQDFTLTARAYPASLDLVPYHRSDPPPYVIAGGLVLRELDVPYLRTWGSEWSKHAPISLLRRYYFAQKGQSPQSRRTVLITSVLASAYNVGYQDVRDEVVERINGHAIGKIEDVIHALTHPEAGFHVIDLTPDSSRGQIVLDAATFEEATAEIVRDYRLPAAVRLRANPLPAGGGECAGDY
jgi:hypothetical protein